MNSDDLVGSMEIAEMLDVVPSAVTNWRNRNVGFPEPWGEWRMGPLWLRDEIEVWHSERLEQQCISKQQRIERLERELERLKNEV